MPAPVAPGSLRVQLLASFRRACVRGSSSASSACSRSRRSSCSSRYDDLLDPARPPHRRGADAGGGGARRLAVGQRSARPASLRADVQRIFEVYFERNVPSRNEALITFLDGQPVPAQPPGRPVPARRRPGARRALGVAHEPDRGERRHARRAGSSTSRVPLLRAERPTRRLRGRHLPRPGPRTRRRGVLARSAASGSPSSCSARCSRGASPTA